MGIEGKCTFGTRMPINIKMHNDVIAREVKYYKPYKTYQPNFACQPLTSKFYARHDGFKVETREQQMHVADFQHHVTQSRARGPLCKYTYSVTENQVYGWYVQTPLVVMDRNDTRFFRPRRESYHTKVHREILAVQAQAKGTK